MWGIFDDAGLRRTIDHSDDPRVAFLINKLTQDEFSSIFPHIDPDKYQPYLLGCHIGQLRLYRINAR